ncbi:MAG: ABC transporter substrate-binding protein [Atopobium sp.]|jgi:extracellular solute-binding protein family 1|uniref:ABC transporter substrate-binding protein n=1 Tax=Lancefieldella parvula TaxID=1382 RepID=A0A9E7AJ83_9ACTN|nr:ABC transporter substrate-binding protein [Lancefieldella parvula]MBS6857034.1 ABC transporter substrate-binding protein [Atopobium sp.]MDU2589692.1 ABC transporter substrate-binding protein [Atopobium sp.]MDU5528357.1 ABC transporter substrate-binding protein [Atopobium sp.]UQF78137.1 MAG: ABC transporter substrate-binding protein [Lancefieldella parvula]
MSNLTRRNFFGVSAVVAGLGITACKKSDSDAGEKKESDTNSTDAVGAPEELVKAAKEEGKLIVYGSCEEEYLNAVCANFKSLYGIDVQAQRLSTGEVAAKIEEENGHPSADVWFGGTTDPYNVTSSKGLLEQYEPKNASHLISDKFKSTNKDWYGIYKGILGILYDKEELQRLKLDVPQDYKDLIDPKYKGLIWSSNYNTAGTAKLIINTVIQKYGHDQGIQYLVDLDKNIAQYTKSGSGPSKAIGAGECTIGIGMLHDGIYQIVDQEHENVGLQIPSSGASYEVGATAIFKGAAHPNAAKLWIEYALSPACVDLAQKNGSYQFLVIDDAKQPEIATEYGLDPNNVMDYNFEDAKKNTEQYVKDVMQALGGGDSRFKTE